jgi:hypothetical protein
MPMQCSNRRIHCQLKIFLRPTDSQHCFFARTWLQVILALMVASQFPDVLQRKFFHPWCVVVPLHYLLQLILFPVIYALDWSCVTQWCVSQLMWSFHVNMSRAMGWYGLLFLELPGLLAAATSTGARSQGPSWSGMALPSHLSRWAISGIFPLA